MVFQPIDEEINKWTQSQAAKKLSPPEKWNSTVSRVAWQMKWSINGLQPQRPVVVLVQDVTLEPGKILLLD